MSEVSDIHIRQNTLSVETKNAYKTNQKFLTYFEGFFVPTHSVYLS